MYIIHGTIQNEKVLFNNKLMSVCQPGNIPGTNLKLYRHVALRVSMIINKLRHSSDVTEDNSG
jgi:hypothetical protein